MDGRTVAGALGALLALALVGFWIAGLVNGIALGSLDALLAPTAASLVVVAVVVLALVAAGSRGGRRLETPYW